MKILISLLVSIGLFSSCKKEATTDTCEQTVAKVAGTYSFTKFETDIYTPGTGYTDVTNDPMHLVACVKDNQLVLNLNGTAAYVDAGAAQCTPSLTDNSGSWSLPAANKIAMSFPTDPAGLTTIADIEYFDCTTLIIVRTALAGEKSRYTLKK